MSADLIALVRELFTYNDGILYWSEHKGKRPVFIGDVAGNFDPLSGRQKIRLRYRLYNRAVLVYAYYHGIWPVEVDHEDHNPINDRIENLREVSHQENMMNVKKRSNNKSGVVGVCWHEEANKWMAFIKADGKQKYLGIFEEFYAAVLARKNAETQYGYHKNHGI